MKLSKFFSVIVIVTTVALLYVRQQVELVKVSYQIREKEGRLSQLLDQNRILRYNVTALKSPRNLERLLATEDIRLRMPQRWQVVWLSKTLPAGEPVGLTALERAKRAFLSFFALKSQAEAKSD